MLHGHKVIYMDSLNVVGIRFVAIKLQTRHVIIIDEILHVLKLTKKLLSISQVTSKGTSQITFFWIMYYYYHNYNWSTPCSQM
jgi:hypothetical protein